MPSNAISLFVLPGHLCSIRINCFEKNYCCFEVLYCRLAVFDLTDCFLKKMPSETSDGILPGQTALNRNSAFSISSRRRNR